MKLVPAFLNMLNLSFSKLKTNYPSRSRRIFEPTDNYSPTTTRLLLLMNIRSHCFCRNIHSNPRQALPGCCDRQTTLEVVLSGEGDVTFGPTSCSSSSTTLRSCRCAGIWFADAPCPLDADYLSLSLAHSLGYACITRQWSLAATSSHCISIGFPKPNPFLSRYIS